MIFVDRQDAGTALARGLARQHELPDVVVGLARGGLIVAELVAAHFGVPLGVATVSVMRAPGKRIGAAAPDGTIWVADGIPLDAEMLEKAAQAAVARARWAQRRLGPAGRVPLRGRDVLIVDEGLSWPGRAAAAARWVRRHGAARIVLAVPMATPDAIDQLSHEVDCLVTLRLDPSLTSHERAYRRLEPVDLARVWEIAREHRAQRRLSHPANVRRPLPTKWRRPSAIAC